LAESDEPLGPVRRQVAVLFVDILRFTRVAEAMTLEAAVAMLRPQRMAGLIFACGGTIISDEIFAIFGLPTPSPHDAFNALRCADGVTTTGIPAPLIPPSSIRDARVLSAWSPPSCPFRVVSETLAMSQFQTLRCPSGMSHLPFEANDPPPSAACQLKPIGLRCRVNLDART